MLESKGRMLDVSVARSEDLGGVKNRMESYKLNRSKEGKCIEVSKHNTLLLGAEKARKVHDNLLTFLS